MSISLFTITSGILAATFFVNALLLLITLTEYRYRKAINMIFAIHLLSIAGWAISLLVLLFFARSEGFPAYFPGETGYLIAKIVFFWATALFATNYWFIQIFIHERLKLSAVNICMLTLQIMAFVVCTMDLVLYTEFAVQPAAYISVVPGALNGVYSLFLLAHVTIPLYLLWHYGKRESDAIKQGQYSILFPYYLVFLIASMTFNWILPVYFNIFNFNALGPTTSLILVTGIICAIARYGFLDIRVIIQRGLIYTILLGFIVLLYTSLLSLSDLLFDSSNVLDDFFSGVTASIIGIITVPPLDRYLRHLTDKIFYKDRYEYSEALHQLSTNLQSSLHMDTLLETCESTLTSILRAKSVKIEPKRFEATDQDLAIPIMLKGKLSGSIIVGPKRSGEHYSKEDMMLLHTFATQAATAISRVFLYQEVKKRADELEVKVSERTKELQATQENQRDMMLHISHNLQTPLAILQTRIEQLKKVTGDNEVTSHLEQSLVHTSQCIHDLLRYARLESRYEELEYSKSSVSTTLHELIEEIHIIAATDDITITHEIEPEVYLTTDHKKLHEVLMNLASNAIKYMGESEVRVITLSLSNHPEHIEIEVSDTGIGLKPEEVSQVFDNFYRSQNTTITKGTGLGLAICKQIITQLGGTLTLVSTPGVGSSFTITLPHQASGTPYSQ